MRSLPLRTVVLVIVASAVVRPAQAQSEIGESFEASVQVVVDSGLTAPVALVPSPDGTGRLFIVDQIGVIKVMIADGSVLPVPFLDLRSRLQPLDPAYDERGLLGLAFHPAYAANGRFFVYYSAPLRPGAPEGYDHTAHVSEFRVAAGDPNRAIPRRSASSCSSISHSSITTVEPSPSVPMTGTCTSRPAMAGARATSGSATPRTGTPTTAAATARTRSTTSSATS